MRDSKTNIVYGKHSVYDLIDDNSDIIIKVYFLSDKKSDHEIESKIRERGISFEKIDKKQDFDILINKYFSNKVNHQNVLALIKPYNYFQLEKELSLQKKNSTVLVLSNITDVANFGAIIRSSVAFDVDLIIIPKDRSVEVNATVFKTSSGLVSKAKICRVVNATRTLDILKKEGYWVYATDSHAKESILDISFAQKRVIVLGSEGKGVPQGVLKNVDATFSIPISSNAESLNVSVAAGICLYHLSQFK